MKRLKGRTANRITSTMPNSLLHLICRLAHRNVAPGLYSRLLWTTVGFALACGIGALAAQSALPQRIADVTPYLIADQVAEVALARSAAPKHVSDAATVLVLTSKGFVEAAAGSNGFTCLVVRSFGGALNDPAFWSPKGSAPHCLNPPAVRTVLPEMLKRAEWVLSGVSRRKIAARTRRAYDSRVFPMPEVGAMAYMMSPHQHLSEGDPHWLPHLMFYFDRKLPASAWGAGGLTAPVIDGTGDNQDSPVRVLFIPVRQWADGTSAVGGKGHP
jgi:hypothetical protein